MRELNEIEIQDVYGGWVPLVYLAAKAFAVGFGLGAVAYGLYFNARAA